MIDMKLERKPKQGDTMLGAAVESDAPEYPYGLRISLDSESLKKLGITDLPALDSEHKLVALVCVVGTSQHESQGSDEPHRSVELQIEQMTLKPASEEPGERTAADRMYG